MNDCVIKKIEHPVYIRYLEDKKEEFVQNFNEGAYEEYCAGVFESSHGYNPLEGPYDDNYTEENFPPPVHFEYTRGRYEPFYRPAFEIVDDWMSGFESHFEFTHGMVSKEWCEFVALERFAAERRFVY